MKTLPCQIVDELLLDQDSWYLIIRLSNEQLFCARLGAK